MSDSALSEDEKLRIRQEEFLRSDIRKELNLPPSAAKARPARLWQGLNSNFGLWLLSAVFITGLGTCYTNHQNAARERLQRLQAEDAAARSTKELKERLALEISFRFSAAMSLLRSADLRFGNSRTEASHKAVIAALAPLNHPATDGGASLYPDFKHFSVLALIAELRRHSPPGEQETLKRLLASTSGLLAEIEAESSEASRTPFAAAGDLLERMKYPSWDNGFAYTDCTKANPFC